MGRTKVDLTGLVFGELRVLEYVSTDRDAIWKCECSCGNIINARSNRLRSGTTKSCGCKRFENSGYKSALNALYHNYKNKAKNGRGNDRVLEFTLTKEQFEHLTSSRCVHCGRLPKQIYTIKQTHDTQSYTYNGIDRIDSNKGYTIDNVETACKTCNFAKNNLPKGEFEAWKIDLITYYLENKQNGTKVMAVV